MKATYPIKFTPILKEKIWGGQKLEKLLNKTSGMKNVGESWEISDVDGSTSIVSNGALKGKSLKEIISEEPEGILGIKNHETFGFDFPLLIKFIDAAKPLSVQLHPDDALASKRHGSFGKTEMWYVMQADKDADLIVGFNQEMDSETYQQHINNKTLTDILNFDKVTSGDTYFIEAGRIHAIGAGVMLAEIQQTSDVTYRVYDWDRVDANGQERELHNDVAIEAFKFDLEDDYRVDYSKSPNEVNSMVHCPYFKTDFLHLDKDLELTNTVDSFYIYMCVQGRAIISVKGFSESIQSGESILLPANVKNYAIKTTNAKFLQIHV